MSWHASSCMPGWNGAELSLMIVFPTNRVLYETPCKDENHTFPEDASVWGASHFLMSPHFFPQGLKTCLFKVKPCTRGPTINRKPFRCRRGQTLWPFTPGAMSPHAASCSTVVCEEQQLCVIDRQSDHLANAGCRVSLPFSLSSEESDIVRLLHILWDDSGAYLHLKLLFVYFSHMSHTRLEWWAGLLIKFTHSSRSALDTENAPLNNMEISIKAVQ